MPYASQADSAMSASLILVCYIHIGRPLYAFYGCEYGKELIEL